MEALCQQLYEGGDAAERVQAESQLSEFCCGSSPDCLQRCRLLLDRSQVAETAFADDGGSWATSTSAGLFPAALPKLLPKAFVLGYRECVFRSILLDANV